MLRKKSLRCLLAMLCLAESHLQAAAQKASEERELRERAAEQRDIEEHEDELIIRYRTAPQGHFLAWSLGTMTGGWGLYEYRSRLPALHLSYSYLNPSGWDMGLKFSVISIHSKGPLAPEYTLDYLRISQRTSRLIPIYHPLSGNIGLSLSYLYPASSILRPWDKDSRAISQLALGTQIGLSFFYSLHHSLSVKYHFWRGLRGIAAWGYEWTFTVAAQL